MSDMQRRRASLHTWVLLVIAAAAPSLLYAQGGVGAIPEHAKARSYGTGWDCEPGYQRVSGACVAIELPANAYLTTAFGRGWECMRGYRARAKLRCDRVAAARVPRAGGDRWKCERGYRSVAERLHAS